MGSSRWGWRHATAAVIACVVAASVSGEPDRVAGGSHAVRDRIQLPDGSQLMLHPDYRVIFRNLPMRWSEGLLLERAHYAATDESSDPRPS